MHNRAGDNQAQEVVGGGSKVLVRDKGFVPNKTKKMSEKLITKINILGAWIFSKSTSLLLDYILRSNKTLHHSAPQNHPHLAKSETNLNWFVTANSAFLDPWSGFAQNSRTKIYRPSVKGTKLLFHII